MREIVHIQAGQCGNQIGAKVSSFLFNSFYLTWKKNMDKFFFSVEKDLVKMATRIKYGEDRLL